MRTRAERRKSEIKEFNKRVEICKAAHCYDSSDEEYIKHKIKYNAEQKGFEEFFIDRDIPENDILYGHIDLNQKIVKNLNDKIEFEYLKGYKALGLVCNLFDDESHSIKIFGENKE